MAIAGTVSPRGEGVPTWGRAVRVGCELGGDPCQSDEDPRGVPRRRRGRGQGREHGGGKRSGLDNPRGGRRSHGGRYRKDATTDERGRGAEGYRTLRGHKDGHGDGASMSASANPSGGVESEDHDGGGSDENG